MRNQIWTQVHGNSNQKLSIIKQEYHRMAVAEPSLALS